MIRFEATPCALCSGDYAATFDGEAFDRGVEPWAIVHTKPACPASANLTPSAFIRENHKAKGFYKEKRST